MRVGVYFSYFLKNYIRSHRYLREIVVILIFNVFFWGFLYTSEPENEVWIVFSTLSLLLNFITMPSLFFLEKSNSLHFSIMRTSGRKNFFLSKFLLILTIDFFWISLFTILYGLKFLNLSYFQLLLPRLLIIIFLMILNISIISLFYSYKPWSIWILMLLIIFGSILNKVALFPIQSFSDVYFIFSFLLPPILEIIYSTVTLDFSFWRVIFITIALLQIVIYFFLNLKLISNKDFL
jgi:hypothetical protein